MSGHRTDILTADGRYFNFVDPDPSTITLNAIARGLANTCRFGGQCRKFYSVAEHSILVSRIVDPEFAVWGLFHDAAEAFICDMPKPLKEMLPDYKAMEQRIERNVFDALGLEGNIPPPVKVADRIALATEQRQLCENDDDWHWTADADPLDVLLSAYSPQAAYEAFLYRAAQLGFRP